MVVQSGAYKSFCLLSPTSSSIKYQVATAEHLFGYEVQQTQQAHIITTEKLD